MSLVENMVAVIMAGGKGERFWPKSRSSMPKQFLSLWGEGTLLQQTFKRAARVTGSAERVYVITGADYMELVSSQLPGLCSENLIVEPASRDTAPAVGYATVFIERRVPGAVMVVMPSDHIVLDEERFVDTMRYAGEVAESGEYLVTVGVRPTRPEEGYGYIECGGVMMEARGRRAFKVVKFKEKPTLDSAFGFIRDGKHLWNAGIFVWRLNSIRAAFHEHAPHLYAGLEEISALLEERIFGQAEYFVEIEQKIRESFFGFERRSIDYTILEKADNILMVTADFGWDDVGTWAALERIFDKDENGNVIKGEAMAIEATGNIIENSVGDKIIVAFGVKDLVIVNSHDAVLVTDKKGSGNLKKVTEALRRQKVRETVATQIDEGHM